MSQVKREIPEKISKIVERWYQQARMLRYIHAFLGFLAIACSLLVASKINTFTPDLIQWLAFVAALSTGLLSGFDLGSKANRMMRAWRLLNAYTIKYEEDSQMPIEQVINAYIEAEKLIGDVKEEPQSV